MEWPSYSPGLNPIENLWALLKKEAYKVYPDLDSLHGKGDEAETQLFQILQRAWVNIRKEVIDGLISSMPVLWYTLLTRAARSGTSCLVYRRITRLTVATISLRLSPQC